MANNKKATKVETPEVPAAAEAPVVKEEAKMHVSTLKGGVVDKKGNVIMIDETGPSKKLSDLLMSRGSYRYSDLKRKLNGTSQSRGFFDHDLPEPKLEEVDFYPIEMGAGLVIWLDKSSSIKFEMERPRPAYLSTIDNPVDARPRTLIVYNSEVELDRIDYSDTYDEGTSILVSVEGKIDHIQNSVLIGPDYRRGEVELYSIFDSEVSFNGFKFEASRVNKTHIENSYVRIPGNIEETFINDSHVSVDKYSHISNAMIKNSHIVCNSLRVGRFAPSDRSLYAPRLNINEFHIYQSDVSIEIFRGFEFDTIGSGYVYNTLTFVPLERTGDKVEFLLFAPKKEGEDYATPTTKVTWDMSKQELRKHVTALLFPKQSTEDVLGTIGTIEGSVINEAVSVLYNRLRIIKQVRTASLL
ncbi:hypothetical protein [Vibrio phage 2 TSL-2019]|uniref:Uncharacterized protein n=1 Tax=Vibrio phage 2 TSL-2019 TaxID=2508172 RepID=A0A513PWG4_9CAUD|nr:hypothetical protein HWC03_gp118 [Vibrio phage 2 TSL-2019]QAU04273.1 hypothetical protein [Vibrio phage 2 TSL-2019]